MDRHDELAAAVLRARRHAATVGPMHSLWETISDAEAVLRATPRNALEIERLLAELIAGTPVRSFDQTSG